MKNTFEQEEIKHLELILEKLHEKHDEVARSIDDYAKDIADAKKYIWENLYELDDLEVSVNRQAVSQSIDTAEDKVRQRKVLEKQIFSPYFGRIDFKEPEDEEPLPLYIGIHTFFDKLFFKMLICDWRAPVSSMFYDFEIGKAHYEAPNGKISGDLTLKRQYRIRNSKMEYMIESSLNILDPVLQEELSKTSDSKMKNIVATIQKEQNSVIRNEEAYVLIIHGVAGSGKTSLALHRLAYLLYKYKNSLSSSNLLIVSPSKVFSDYISDVLPELGEEGIIEVNFDDIAKKELLGKKLKYQSFDQQVEELLESPDEAAIERIQFKSNNEFLCKMNEYIEFIETEYYKPTRITVNDIEFSKEYIMRLYRAYRKLPIMVRFDEMATDLAANIEDKKFKKLKKNDINKIAKTLYKMFEISDVYKLYRGFFEWLKKPGMMKLKSAKCLEYSDVFPYIYLKTHVEGSNSFDFVMHLVVDEMQDYSPVQYAVLSKLFKCRKTILGDFHQTVNPHISSSPEEIGKVFDSFELVELLKSYRSTIEITNLAQKIISNEKLIAIERHGDIPQITKSKGATDQVKLIKDRIRNFPASGYETLAIICKTRTMAEQLYGTLKKGCKKLQILLPDSMEFQSGIIVTTTHMSKGLEFDHVIVPFANEETYKTELDRSMLYISCTRAMHKLDILYFKKLTKFLA